MRGEISVATPAGKSKDIVLGHFLHEANTAGAKNTALIIQGDPWPKLHSFRFFDFFLEKPRPAGAILYAEFL